MIAGRLTLPMAMRHPGMFLSQPGMAMFASYHCPPITVSIESAITSRDCRENDIPAKTKASAVRDGICGIAIVRYDRIRYGVVR